MCGPVGARLDSWQTVQGELVAWSKLSAIEANRGIEIKLDECLSELVKSLKRQGDEPRLYRKSNASRIPSFAQLPTRESPD
jgi:hypothetical protein